MEHDLFDETFDTICHVLSQHIKHQYSLESWR